MTKRGIVLSTNQKLPAKKGGDVIWIKDKTFSKDLLWPWVGCRERVVEELFCFRTPHWFYKVLI
jgi:hypothetical protein